MQTVNDIGKNVFDNMVGQLSTDYIIVIGQENNKSEWYRVSLCSTVISWINTQDYKLWQILDKKSHDVTKKEYLIHEKLLTLIKLKWA